MNCQICLNPFDHSKFKPYSLSCPHTVCISCINSLIAKECPNCKTEITIFNPNLALLELIPESSYDKLKKELFTLLCETSELKSKVDADREQKLKVDCSKVKETKEQIKSETKYLIEILKVNEQFLLSEADDRFESTEDKLRFCG